jgi:hypothetical protein
VYLDCDAAFVNPQRSLDELLTSEHEFFIAPDCMPYSQIIHFINAAQKVINIINTEKDFMNCFEDKLLHDTIEENQTLSFALSRPILNPNGFNSGFFIIKTTDKMRILLNEIKHFNKYFANFDCDQGCLGLLLQYKEFHEVMKKLPAYTQRKYGIN